MYSFDQAKRRVECLDEVIILVRGTPLGLKKTVQSSFLMSSVLYANELSRARGWLYTKELTHNAENIHVPNDHCVDVMTTVDGELNVAT